MKNTDVVKDWWRAPAEHPHAAEEEHQPSLPLGWHGSWSAITTEYHLVDYFTSLNSSRLDNNVIQQGGLMDNQTNKRKNYTEEDDQFLDYMLH